MQYFFVNFFKRFKKALKRAIIFILILGGISITVLTIINMRKFFSTRDTIEVFIDTDSISKADNLLSIYRALIAPELDIIGISLNEYRSISENMNDSLHSLKKTYDPILNYMGEYAIPLHQGMNDNYDYRALADRKPSEASVFIINEAHNKKKDEKLNIIILGSLTNVANAILTDPEIIPQIRLYFSGFKYDSRARVWNKNEPNVRKDLDAVDMLLDTPGLEMHIMTVTTSEKLRISNKKIDILMKGKGGIMEFLYKKWKEEPDVNKEKIMKNLALIEALVNPQYAKEQPVLTPPENLRREIFVYTYINNDQMIMSFEKSIKKKIQEEDKKLRN